MAKRKLPKGDCTIDVEFTPEEAIIAVGIVTIAADAEVEDVEAEWLVSILEEIELFENYETEEIDEMFNKVKAISDEEGVEGLLNTAVAALPNKHLRDAALMTAMLIVSADDEIPEDEEDFLGALQGLLRISDDRYNEIIDELFGAEEEEYEEEEEEEEALA